MTDAMHQPASGQVGSQARDPRLEPDETVSDIDAASGFYEAEGDGFHLEERDALRRVAGLGTELEDVTEVEYRQLRLERVVLVGVWTSGSQADADNSMAELAALAETAGSQVLDAVIQRRDRPDAATYIGKGKARDLADVVIATGADTVVCDGELTPGQLRQLEEVVKVKVIDRTALILDIFAQHATSREGKAQVELAQLTYLLPRLRGWGESLSRQGGGIGTRGPGETKIETDRRRIRTRMSKLKQETAAFASTRETKRSSRRRSEIPSIAICGYTNAGKSSILNRLTGAGVLVENALFATLDPTVRKASLPSGREATLTDTVGFVRHLPHQLVEAFRSTLEEVSGADLVLHVVDGADPDPEGQLAAVRRVLGEVGALDIPQIVVINKIDAADPLVLSRIRHTERHCVLVSARTGEGLADLVAAIERDLPRPSVPVAACIPYSRGDLVALIHRYGEVESEEFVPQGTLIIGRVRPSLAAALDEFAVAPA